MDGLAGTILAADLTVMVTPKNNPDQAARLSNLANMLMNRYHRTGNMNGLQAVISKAELAALNTPETTPTEQQDD